MHSCTKLIIQHDEYSGQMARVNQSFQNVAAQSGTCLRQYSRVTFSSAESSRVQQALESELHIASFKPILICSGLIKRKAITPRATSQRCLRVSFQTQLPVRDTVHFLSHTTGPSQQIFAIFRKTRL